jgi:hypothetical protein
MRPSRAFCSSSARKGRCETSSGRAALAWARYQNNAEVVAPLNAHGAPE